LAATALRNEVQLDSVGAGLLANLFGQSPCSAWADAFASKPAPTDSGVSVEEPLQPLLEHAVFCPHLFKLFQQVQRQRNAAPFQLQLMM
jgi:hypothetical protein